MLQNNATKAKGRINFFFIQMCLGRFVAVKISIVYPFKGSLVNKYGVLSHNFISAKSLANPAKCSLFKLLFVTMMTLDYNT